MIWDCRLDSRKTSILISNTDFPTIGCSEKWVYKAWFWKNCESSWFEIVTRTHARVSSSFSMVVHFEEVRLSMNLENFVDMVRLACFEIVNQPPAWLRYSFITQIFLLSVVLKKEYMKLKFDKIMKIVSQTCVEIVVGTQAWLLWFLYSFIIRIFLQ